MSDDTIEIVVYENYKERLKEFAEYIVSVHQSESVDEIMDDILNALDPDYGCDVCEHCNRPDRTTSNKMSPFAYEIHGEEVYSMMCDSCEYQSSMDI